MRICMFRAEVLILILVFFVQRVIAQHDQAATDETTNSAAFNAIKSLEGNWVGTYQWTGLSAKGKMDAKYYLTAYFEY
jgi:hypothetical protein